MSNSTIERSKGSIPGLTGIRGLAALLVVAYHFPIQAAYGLESNVRLVDQGFYAVDLFFILSGFILMYVHADDFVALGTTQLKAFFRLRFFRVYPLHFFTLMTILGFVGSCPGFIDWFRGLPSDTGGVPFSLPGFFQTLTLTNRIGLPDLGEWNGPTWSLSSEMLGYAVFPFLAYALMRVRSAKACYGLAIICLTLFCCIIYVRGHIGMPRMAFCFLAGMALGRAKDIVGQSPRLASTLTSISGTLSVLTLLSAKTAPLSVFFFAGSIYGLSLGVSFVSVILSSWPMMFLGRISFSLYLTHYILLQGLIWALWNGSFSRLSNPTLALLGLATSCLAVAYVAYRLVEKPFQSYGRHGRHAPQPAAKGAGLLTRLIHRSVWEGWRT